MDEDIRRQKDIEYHKKTAHEYDRVVVDPRRIGSDFLFQQIDRSVGVLSGERFLDLGSGTGHMVGRYGTGFSTIHCVDHSAEMLNALRHNLKSPVSQKNQFFEEDVIGFAKKISQPYNLITCVGCLHHLSAQQQRELLSLIAKNAASQESTIIIADPVTVSEATPAEIDQWNARSTAATLSYSDTTAEDPDEAPIALEEYRAMIEDAGLTISKEVRSWEVFSHTNEPSAYERDQIIGLLTRHPNQGNVFVAALRVK